LKFNELLKKRKSIKTPGVGKPKISKLHLMDIMLYHNEKSEERLLITRIYQPQNHKSIPNDNNFKVLYC
jgi:hypothetical protein